MEKKRDHTLQIKEVENKSYFKGSFSYFSPCPYNHGKARRSERDGVEMRGV